MLNTQAKWIATIPKNNIPIQPMCIRTFATTKFRKLTKKTLPRGVYHVAGPKLSRSKKTFNVGIIGGLNGEAKTGTRVVKKLMEDAKQENLIPGVANSTVTMMLGCPSTFEKCERHKLSDINACFGDEHLSQDISLLDKEHYRTNDIKRAQELAPILEGLDVLINFDSCYNGPRFIFLKGQVEDEHFLLSSYFQPKENVINRELTPCIVDQKHLTSGGEIKTATDVVQRNGGKAVNVFNGGFSDTSTADELYEQARLFLDHYLNINAPSDVIEFAHEHSSFMPFKYSLSLPLNKIDILKSDQLDPKSKAKVENAVKERPTIVPPFYGAIFQPSVVTFELKKRKNKNFRYKTKDGPLNLEQFVSKEVLGENFYLNQDGEEVVTPYKHDYWVRALFPQHPDLLKLEESSDIIMYSVSKPKFKDDHKKFRHRPRKLTRNNYPQSIIKRTLRLNEHPFLAALSTSKDYVYFKKDKGASMRSYAKEDIEETTILDEIVTASRQRRAFTGTDQITMRKTNMIVLLQEFEEYCRQVDANPTKIPYTSRQLRENLLHFPFGDETQLPITIYPTSLRYDGVFGAVVQKPFKSPRLQFPFKLYRASSGNFVYLGIERLVDTTKPYLLQKLEDQFAAISGKTRTVNGTVIDYLGFEMGECSITWLPDKTPKAEIEGDNKTNVGDAYIYLAEILDVFKRVQQGHKYSKDNSTLIQGQPVYQKDGVLHRYDYEPFRRTWHIPNDYTFTQTKNGRVRAKKNVVDTIYPTRLQLENNSMLDDKDEIKVKTMQMEETTPVEVNVESTTDVPIAPESNLREDVPSPLSVHEVSSDPQDTASGFQANVVVSLNHEEMKNFWQSSGPAQKL